ncbi:MAG: hypothetical protein EAZ89_02810 [Bacteroidetes bacterium]|nr:MAG: hypothetical protein EAZ89_02810 [Bacteroidota bacterium]
MRRIFTFVALLGAVTLLSGQGTWLQKASVGAAGRFWSIAFSIGGKGYGGTGKLSFSGSRTDDFWEYDPAADTWTQKANVPGGAREGMDGFAIGDKGYAAFGTSFIAFGSDLYQYDPATNNWTAKSSVPGGVGFAFSHGFVIDSTYYIGPENGTNNFYAYNGASDTWSVKADFPGADRRAQVTFSLRGKGYLGLGAGVFGGVSRDMWSYNPATDTWTKVADMDIPSDQSTAFSTGGFGYVYNVGQNGSNLYRYDPDLNEWTFDSSKPGDRTANAAGFSIGNKGYVVFGQETISGGNPSSNKLWEFTPGLPNALEPAGISAANLQIRSATQEHIYLTVNGLGGKLTQLSLCDLQGRTLAETRIEARDEWQGTLSFTALSPGIYLLRASREGERATALKVWIH